MQPSIGRIVQYTLSAGDVTVINQRRAALKAALQAGGEPSPYIGNTVEAGQVYPAQIVRHFGGTTVNLKVALDGADDYWATSRTEHSGDGDGHGSWVWPARV